MLRMPARYRYARLIEKGDGMRWFAGLFGTGNSDDDALVASSAGLPIVREPAAQNRKSALPRFRGTSADKVSAGGRALDKFRLQLRTAFTPSRPVIDATMFAGRAGLLRTLIRSIEDQHLHVILFGPRGIGKTSTVHILCHIAREARYLVRYVSCGERTEFDELMRAIIRDIPLLFHSNYEPTSDEAEEGLSFADLVGDAPLTVASVSDILSKISGTRLLIVLDEFDRASSADFRLSTAELIKNLSDRGSRVQLVIAGVAQNMNEIIEHIPSIRRNIVGMQLPNMTDEEIGELIKNGEESSGLHFTADALQLICDLALGLPYLASLISQHAGFAALDRERTQVERVDVESAIKVALEEIELRIAPTNRHQVSRAFADGRERELGLLARVALRDSGRLTIAATQTAIDLKVSADMYLRELGAHYHLLKLDSDDPAGGFVFVDDGIPLYLWMRLTQDHVLRNITTRL
jgi:Cdc6-like AAA superfamily ATPase